MAAEIRQFPTGVFNCLGSVLPGYMFRYQYCLVGGLEAIVLGSIRWCVWSFRPSSPLRLPHLKCLLLLLIVGGVLDHGLCLAWTHVSVSTTSMWPCVFVSVGTAISPVVLMWWTYRISCSRQVNIWICLIRSRRQMFLVIRLMRNWLKSR